MLHVKSIRGKLSFIFREKERRFGVDFLFGLSIAVVIHLIGFSLFKITTLPFEKHFTHNPIQVEVDQSHSRTALKTAAPPFARDDSPQYTTPMQQLPLTETTFEFSCQEPDFSAIETIDYEALDIDFEDDRD
ncbi:MAG: hypothetical protein S4CHLAM45_06400 [Chlamydiales bacterium]|nr:hypothetical protein [Chlamydiales bacterium]MCH9619820.1 hypothetical protein [Chlamydiales bacterium]MCH9622753.1 hypothetical protein [Chlamydiales bacterium]